MAIERAITSVVVVPYLESKNMGPGVTAPRISLVTMHKGTFHASEQLSGTF